MEIQEDIKVYIGKAIRKKRQTQKITLKALAKQIGSTESYISNIELGKCQYTFVFLEKIIQALDYKNYNEFFNDLCQ